VADGAAGDPTDGAFPADDASLIADIGELAAAGRLTVALEDEDSDSDALADTAQPYGVAPEPLVRFDAPAVDAQDPVLVFVSDDSAESDMLSAPADASLPPQTGEIVGQGTTPEPVADYQAHVTEEVGSAAAAPDADPRRIVKRVRVVRRLMVNGQVVRETSAEQLVDADADTQETAASLQRTLATADPDTLQSLAADLSASGGAGSQAPGASSATPDGMGASGDQAPNQ
jgi:hypothetical protein